MAEVIESIEALPAALDRALLHIFVFGSAVGEAVAVALPERGWILVDGCSLKIEDEDRFPALEAFEEMRAGDEDPLELLVWTHPHADHYVGIRECVENLKPRRVGMTLIEAPAPGSTALELAALGTHPTLPADLRVQDVFKMLRSTLNRVFLYWLEQPSSRLLLTAETEALHLGRTVVRTFSPNQKALRSFYGLPRDDLRVALKERANEYSIVLGLEYGKSRVVLGGDLPHRRNGAILPHAWDQVSKTFPELSNHDVFKVSHHGSAEAFPPAFARRPERREWIVAPFAKSRLPRPDDDETGGLRESLRRVDHVRLTSSVGLVTPTSPGARVARSVLRASLDAVKAGKFSKGLRPPKAENIFDFAWGIALDDSNSVRRLFAGKQALTVFEG
jgi:hypothetical protein